jgi:hypothetical protein
MRPPKDIAAIADGRPFALARPDRVKSRHVPSVAKRLSDTVSTISVATVEAYRLGIVDDASKLDIRTANVYSHPELRCWLVGTSSSSFPAP